MELGLVQYSVRTLATPFSGFVSRKLSERLGCHSAIVKRGGVTLRQLDPQAKLLIEKAEAAGNPELYDLEPDAARELFLNLVKAVSVDPVEVDSVVDQGIPGPTEEIMVRIYRPLRAKDNPPALIYFHGGGWVYRTC